MRSVLFDYKSAFDSLRKSPGFVLSILILLGVTIGFVISIFGLNYLLLKEPLPYPNQSALVTVDVSLWEKEEEKVQSALLYPVAEQLRSNHSDEFEEVSLIKYERAAASNHPDTPLLNVAFVSKEYFSILDLNTLQGKASSIYASLDEGTPTALISENIWREYYDGSEEILGQSIVINNTGFRVVGIVVESFKGTQLTPDLGSPGIWLPWSFNSGKETAQNWGLFQGNLKVIAKLKGTKFESEESLSEQFSDIYNIKFKENTAGMAFFAPMHISLKIENLASSILGDAYKSALILFLAVVALLLIALSNVINLIVARYAAKSHNLAMRSFLGANGRQIYTYLFAEISILLLGSALLAMLVSMPSMELIKGLSISYFPRVELLAFSGVEFLFLFVLVILIALFIAYSVYLRVDRKELINSIGNSGKGVAITLSKRMRAFLVSVQVFIATTLLCLSMLLFWVSVQNLLKPIPIQIEDRFQIVLSSKVEISTEDEQRIRAIEQVKDSLASQGEFQQVSLGSNWPFSRSGRRAMRDGIDTEKQYSFGITQVDDRWAELFNMNLLEGRMFSAIESRDNQLKFLVNEAAAAEISNGDDLGSAIGKRIYWYGPDKDHEVIGVLENVSLPGQTAEPMVYTLNLQRPSLFVNINPSYSIDKASINVILASIDSRFYASDLVSLQQSYDDIMSRDVVLACISLALAVLSGILIFVGMFGLLSYHVRVTARDISIRRAIGANFRDLVSEELSFISKPVAYGMLLFIVLFVLLSVFKIDVLSVVLSSLTQSLIFAILSMFIVAVSIVIASYIPLLKLHKSPLANSLAS